MVRWRQPVVTPTASARDDGGADQRPYHASPTDLVPLSTLDHVFAGPSVEPTLTRLDERSYAFDLRRELAEVRVGTMVADAPLAACVDAVRTQVGQPLARARVADLGARGTAIALSLSHAVADGNGYFIFMSAWAARSRGAAPVEVAADRRVLTHRGPVSAGTAPACGTLPKSGFFVGPRDTPGADLRIHERRVPRRQLAPPAGFTVNDWICAALWKEAWTDEPAGMTTVRLSGRCPHASRRRGPKVLRKRHLDGRHGAARSGFRRDQPLAHADRATRLRGRRAGGGRHRAFGPPP
jgi:hypothetical protein